MLYYEYSNSRSHLTQAFQQCFCLWSACCISCIIKLSVLILCMHMSVYWLHCVCCESVRWWLPAEGISWGIFLRRSRAPVSAAAHRVPETHFPGTFPNTSGSNALNLPREMCWTRPREPSSASQVCSSLQLMARWTRARGNVILILLKSKCMQADMLMVISVSLSNRGTNHSSMNHSGIFQPQSCGTS